MLGVTHSVHCGIAFLDDSALRTAAAIMAHLQTVFRITVGALLTPALTISSTGALGHFFLVIPALRAARADRFPVVHIYEVLSLTWGTFTLTTVPVAWINEVSASRAELAAEVLVFKLIRLTLGCAAYLEDP